MGIEGIEILTESGDEPRPELERLPCPNIFHKHRAHEWGEKGHVYWCNGAQ